MRCDLGQPMVFLAGHLSSSSSNSPRGNTLHTLVDSTSRSRGTKDKNPYRFRIDAHSKPNLEIRHRSGIL